MHKDDPTGVLNTAGNAFGSHNATLHIALPASTLCTKAMVAAVNRVQILER